MKISKNENGECVVITSIEELEAIQGCINFCESEGKADPLDLEICYQIVSFLNQQKGKS